MSIIDGISGAIGKGIEAVKATAEDVLEKIKGNGNKQKASEVASKSDENESVDSTQLEDDTKTSGWAALSERKRAYNEEFALIQEAQVLKAKIDQYKLNPSSMTKEEYEEALVRLKEIQVELKMKQTEREIEDVEKAIESDVKTETPKFS